MDSNLPIIAVHSPRFGYENSAALVRQTLENLGSTFPTIHDPDLYIWDEFQPDELPGMVLINPGGERIQGENGVLATQLLEEALQAPTDKAPTPPLIKIAEQSKPLNWPSGVAVTDSGSFAIADASLGHVLVADFSEDTMSAKIIALIDLVKRPGALTFKGEDLLYISDLDAGTIHELDLSNDKAKIVAQGLGAVQGLTIDDNGDLLISDTTNNSIYRLSDNKTEVLSAVAGSGLLGAVDGKAEEAQLARPSGITSIGTEIIFADGAASNIREVNVDGTVRTINGGPDFRWGLEDGADSGLLQNPMGIAGLANGIVAIADTGNNLVRILDNEEISTLPFKGLKHPEGICSTGNGGLILSDSGNCRLIYIDPTLSTAQVIALS